MRESEVHPHHPDERAHLYHAEDGTGSEDETLSLLTALVYSFKPGLILETGTHLGAGTRALALGCQQNGFGRVISIDRDPEKLKVARSRLEDLGCSIELILSDSRSFLKTTDYTFHFAFLDSDLPARIEEMKILRERGLLRGPVLIHDTSRLRSTTFPDAPDFPRDLDLLDLPSVENRFSRGWRLFDLR